MTKTVAIHDGFVMFANCVKRILHEFARIISPPFCTYCHRLLKDRTVFCGHCFEKIKPIVSKELKISKTFSIPVFAVANYCDPLRPLVLAKNYKNKLAGRQLGWCAWTRTSIRHRNFDCLVPVPLHWTRVSSRGFNQSLEMAREISHESGKPVADILKRRRRTVFQSSLASEERVKNVRDVFELSGCDRDAYRGKHIVLVDDLMTTGATLKYAVKEIRKLKPASICAVVACRVC